MNDFVISLRDLPHQAGSVKEVELTVPAPADLGNAMIGAKPGSPVRMQATLTSMTDGVLVSGSAQVPNAAAVSMRSAMSKTLTSQRCFSCRK